MRGFINGIDACGRHVTPVIPGAVGFKWQLRAWFVHPSKTRERTPVQYRLGEGDAARTRYGGPGQSSAARDINQGANDGRSHRRHKSPPADAGGDRTPSL